MKDKVILYGIGSKMLRNRFWYLNNFQIIAFSDINQKKSKDIPFENIPYVNPGDIHVLDYDYIIIASVYSTQIKNNLINNLNIDPKKIYSDHEIYMKNFMNNIQTFGSKNKDKTIVIIGREGKTYGLFWYYNYYIQYIREIVNRGFFPVIDMKNFVNIYLEESEIGHVNAWEYYFEQPVNISVEEAYESANVIEVPQDVTYISEGNFAVGNVYYNKEVRKIFHEIGLKYIRLNNKMKNKINYQYECLIKSKKDAGKKILGVLYRGTDFVNIKPYLHCIQPTIEQCINETKDLFDKWKCDYIYMASDDEVAINEMWQTFGDKFICYERKRFSNTNNTRLAFIPFERENDRYIKGYDYLTEIYLLSKCDSIIAGKAGGTVGALILNGCQYEHEYFFELGLYGINN